MNNRATVNDYTEKGIIFPTYQQYCHRFLEHDEAVYVKAGSFGKIKPGDSIFCLGIKPVHGLMASATIAGAVEYDNASRIWHRFHNKIVMGRSDFFNYARDRKISAIPIVNIRLLDLPKRVLSYMNCKVNPQNYNYVFGKLLKELNAIAAGKTGMLTPNGLGVGDIFYIIGDRRTMALRLMSEIVYADEFEQPVESGLKSATFRQGIRLPAFLENVPLKTAGGKLIGKANVEKILIGQLGTALKGLTGDEFFKREGVFKTVQDLLATLRKFYQNIDMQEVVTGIAHTKPIS